jgi:cytidylate kinase
MLNKKIIITIDGPAGAGKTTVSRFLAERLGYKYIDTGALYRAIALAVMESRVDYFNDSELSVLFSGIGLKFILNEKGPRLVLNGQDITERIRTPEITMLASSVSARPVVRKYLLNIQRELGMEKGAVFEGRDMGTVVFPEAEVKFYLNASEKERAKRRFKELSSKSFASSVTLEQVEADMKRRDKDDSTRELAPLKPANDAVIINSSGVSVEDVVNIMLLEIEKYSNRIRLV